MKKFLVMMLAMSSVSAFATVQEAKEDPLYIQVTRVSEKLLSKTNPLKLVVYLCGQAAGQGMECRDIGAISIKQNQQYESLGAMFDKAEVADFSAKHPGLQRLGFGIARKAKSGALNPISKVPSIYRSEVQTYKRMPLDLELDSGEVISIEAIASPIIGG